jgi:hypothetical protein
LLNNVIYNKRNYVANNVSHKKLTKQKLWSFSMRCQEQTEEKLFFICLFNDSKTSAYVTYCPQGMPRSFWMLILGACERKVL